MNDLAGDSSAERAPLIGLAHGSRHPGVVAAIDAVLQVVSDRYGIATRTAFLDLTAPDLDAVAADLAAAGHRSAVVVPLLFTEAFHATVDVPEALEAATSSTGLRLRLAPILGTGDDVAAVVAASAAEAGIGPERTTLVYAVGSSRPDANAAVADLAVRVGERRGGPSVVGFGTTEPRAEGVLTGLVGPVGIVPLFLAPGLLLDPLVAWAGERGVPIAPPLGTRMADVVWARYQETADLPVGLG